MNQIQNSSIEAIIFDVGGVLIRTLDPSGRREWEDHLGLPPGGAEHIVFSSEMGSRAQLGEISDSELWEYIRDHLQLGDRIDAFRRDFWRGDAVDRSLLNLVRTLNVRYQTAIISNATDNLLETLERYEIMPEFDLIVGSAYEGVMKPDPVIFNTTLARLGRKSNETIFIDDAPANIAGAMAIGMHTILFTPAIDLAAELGSMGVWVGSNTR